MPDYHRLELAWFFVIAAALAAVTPVILWWPKAHQLGYLFLFGPEIIAALWLATLILAFRVHHWRGMWLLITAIVALPATYIHAGLVWGCVFSGNCL
jgi:hypothetical protein